MTLISQLYIMQWVSKLRDPRPLQGSSNAVSILVSGCYNTKREYSAQWPPSLSKGISGSNPEMTRENEETDDCIAGILWEPTKYISGRQLTVFIYLFCGVVPLIGPDFHFIFSSSILICDFVSIFNYNHLFQDTYSVFLRWICGSNIIEQLNNCFR